MYSGILQITISLSNQSIIIIVNCIAPIPYAPSTIFSSLSIENLREVDGNFFIWLYDINNIPAIGSNYNVDAYVTNSNGVSFNITQSSFNTNKWVITYNMQFLGIYNTTIIINGNIAGYCLISISPGQSTVQQSQYLTSTNQTLEDNINFLIEGQESFEIISRDKNGDFVPHGKNFYLCSFNYFKVEKIGMLLFSLMMNILP